MKQPIEMRRPDDRPTGRLSLSEVRAAWDRVARLGLSWDTHPVQYGIVDYGMRATRHPNHGLVVEFRVKRMMMVRGDQTCRVRALVGEGYIIGAFTDDLRHAMAARALEGTDDPT